MRHEEEPDCTESTKMIELTEGAKCSFENCDKPATTIACGKTGHPEPALYCKTHATAVKNEDSPEYTEVCPNCGCQFGSGK